jgi:hypothetical protein
MIRGDRAQNHKNNMFEHGNDFREFISAEILKSIQLMTHAAFANQYVEKHVELS